VCANPVDRAKRGSKLHLAVEGDGLALSLLVTGANSNDSLLLPPGTDDGKAAARSGWRDHKRAHDRVLAICR
jgi:hypothetical protein